MPRRSATRVHRARSAEVVFEPQRPLDLVYVRSREEHLVGEVDIVERLSAPHGPRDDAITCTPQGRLRDAPDVPPRAARGSPGHDAVTHRAGASITVVRRSRAGAPRIDLPSRGPAPGPRRGRHGTCSRGRARDQPLPDRVVGHSSEGGSYSARGGQGRRSSTSAAADLRRGTESTDGDGLSVHRSHSVSDADRHARVGDA